MGVFLDYWWKAECSEAELVGRLEGLRARILGLEVGSVSEVFRVEPVCDSLAFLFMEERGFTLPTAVAEALERKVPPGKPHWDWCIALNSITTRGRFDEDLLRRYHRPLLDFLDSPHGLWDAPTLPEWVGDAFCRIYRAGLEKAFADALLKYGYCLNFDVDPGCESFIIGLSAYRNAEQPLWLGSHFTKTQYAERFVHAHETLCRVMDMAGEGGLLAGGDDTCGFYHHRDWSKSAEIVNTVTTFARTMSRVFSDAEEASGGAIQVISDPVRRSYNIINAGPAKTEPAGPGAEEVPGDMDRPRDE